VQHFLGDLRTWPHRDRLRNTPGVYKILVVSDDGQRKPLPRIGGIDPNGVLYIGRSDHLRGRLNTLRSMLFAGATRGAIAGLTYKASPRIRSIAPRSQLVFRFEHCSDCRTRERVLLRRYFRRFGEVPPLNGRAEFITPEASV
jgi:hypothetical protein